MQIEVIYLGGSRSETGCSREALEVPADATVGDAVSAVFARHPALAAWQNRVRWACNFEFVPLTAKLRANDELALLPPVCGGAPRACLTTEPLEPQKVATQVAGPGVGATVLFVGTVRDHHHGADIEAITYEAYSPMAERQLDRIAHAHSIDGVEVAIVHRHGHLQVGEASVVIAAASAHRAEAFAACRAVLEAIKADVPIYKREYGTQGESWVGWGGG